MKLICATLIIAVIMVSGCTTQQSPVTEITIPGHPVYTFSSDVREALKYTITNATEIQRAIYKTDHMNIVFNGSSVEDSRDLQVVLYNLVTKIQTFYVYNGAIMKFDTYYFIGDKWYNMTNETYQPIYYGITLIIKGPNTGASENSIKYANGTIVLQGKTYNDLKLAGDRLALAVLGVQNVP